ncbi:MAG: hypothetical protein MZV64_43690 [Ignavibacteriales bacterium]|nr:hypothetical protein [Ignavibacteriales bacterium]
MKSLEQTVDRPGQAFPPARRDLRTSPRTTRCTRTCARRSGAFPTIIMSELPQHDVRERLPRGREPVHRRLRRSPRRRLRRRRRRPGRLLLRLRRRPRQGDRIPRASRTSASTPSTPGVRKPYQSYGLGILLKEFQRETVLGLIGVSTIICTYDPADRRQRPPQRPSLRHGRPGIPRGHLRRVRRAAQPDRRARRTAS